MRGVVCINLAYVRVSSADQNPERQILKMQGLGIEERYIFVDKASGKDFSRSAWQAMMNVVRRGDIIFIDALDRLGRNYDEIILQWKHITREIGCDIVALDNEGLFDSRKYKELGDLGKLQEDLILTILSWVAEQERLKIRQRQREGIDLAMAEGRYKGRPEITVDSDMFNSVYVRWRSGEIKAVEAMHILDLKKDKFYRLVREIEKR